MGANADLGLPVGKMRQVVVAIDVDGTLRNNQITDRVVANEDIRDLVRILHRMKNVYIIVWSGSGHLYARQCAKEMHIDQWVNEFASKTEHKELTPDIAIDDIQDTALGHFNLIVREK